MHVDAPRLRALRARRHGRHQLPELPRSLHPAVRRNQDPVRVPSDRQPGRTAGERLPAGLCGRHDSIWHLGRPGRAQDGGRYRRHDLEPGHALHRRGTELHTALRCASGARDRGSKLLSGRHGASGRLLQERRPGPGHVDLGGGHRGRDRRGLCRRRDRRQHPRLARGLLHDRSPRPDLRDPGIRASRAIAWCRRGERSTDAEGTIDYLADVSPTLTDPDSAFHHRRRNRAVLRSGRRGVLASDLPQPALRPRDRNRRDAGRRRPGAGAACRVTLRRDHRGSPHDPTRVSQQPPIGIAGFLAGAVFVALALLMPSLLLFVPMFLLGAACLYLYNGPYTAIKQNVVLPTVRASAVTLALLIEHLLGDSYAPFAIGKLSDALGSLQLALLILLPPLLLLAALAASTGIKHEDRDGRAMEARWASASSLP